MESAGEVEITFSLNGLGSNELATNLSVVISVQDDKTGAVELCYYTALTLHTSNKSREGFLFS